MNPEEVRELPVIQALLANDASSVLASSHVLSETAVTLDPSKILSISRFLKDDQQFVRLCAVTALDWHPMEPRFEVVYLLHSINRNQRLRLKCPLPGDKPELDSVVEIWPGANWYEREVFDLFGISFRNHPDLTRIMMPDSWEGHPLRKDFPVSGFRYTYKDE